MKKQQDEFDTVSGNCTDKNSSNFPEEEGTNKSNADNVSGNSTVGTKDDEEEKLDREVEYTNHTTKAADEPMPERLLDYTTMTLPCVDFPAMKKRNKAAAESNSAIIPPLHVTVSLFCGFFLFRRPHDTAKHCFILILIYFTNSWFSIHYYALIFLI